MAVKLFVKLQTPTIELKVEAKDVSGSKEYINIGFKRYEIKEAEAKIEQLKTVSEDFKNLDTNEVIKFIKNEVVYIKQAKVELFDDELNLPKDLVISDTRTVKPNEGLWGTPDECLAVLLDLYLASAPWRLSLIIALQQALINVDYKEAELKN